MNRNNKNILFIHQSAELYGSDKTLLFLVKELKNEGVTPLVVLPNVGPLKILLEKENIKVFIAPVLKVSRKMFNVKNITSLPVEIKKSYQILEKIRKEYNVETIYSNTLAVLIGFLFARKRNLKHVWHVHEIIESPTVVTSFFRKLLSSKFTTTIIYNSAATALFWNQNNKELTNKTIVVWNGLDRPELDSNLAVQLETRAKLFQAKNADVIIALIGRISRWKGQQLLLEAFSKISISHPNSKLAFIGSAPPNQEVFQEILQRKIVEYSLENKVFIIPFQENVWTIWDAIDIAVIPSTEPEPFGLVAIEAMLAKKPVIAANHGGLQEIIINNETGILFEPRNVEKLQAAIEELLLDESKSAAFGEKGYERATTAFSLKQYVSKIREVLQ